MRCELTGWLKYKLGYVAELEGTLRYFSWFSFETLEYVKISGVCNLWTDKQEMILMKVSICNVSLKISKNYKCLRLFMMCLVMNFSESKKLF